MAFRNLTGQKFDRWTVVAFAGVRHDEGFWQCKCDCGTIRNVKAGQLRSKASRSCGCLRKEILRQKQKRGPSHPHWKGGISFQDGYITVYDRQRKKVFMHKLIAEHALGRKSKPNEVVHHINGNKTDNRNCNLLICSKSYHLWFHSHMSQKYMERHLS